METRVAVISIIVENNETVEKLNALLHDYGQIIIGRMGIPYRQRGIKVVCIILVSETPFSFIRSSSSVT